ncbi:HAMP domain-containing protein [Billgrantia azerbaijanica]|nr:HAMP domain-containing protein [Halomonas azerbaijanica]
MRRLNNLSVRMSWTLVLVAFLAMLLGLSALGLYAVQHSQRHFDAFSRINVGQQAALNRTNSMLQAARLEAARLYETLIESDAGLSNVRRRERAQAIQASLQRARDAFDDFLSLPAEPSHETLIQPIDERFEALLTQRLLPQAEALAEGNTARYRALRDDAHDAYGAFYQAAIGFFHTVEAEGSARADGFTRVVDVTRIAIVAIFLGALGVVAIVYWGVGANLIRPLEGVIEHFQRMAKGDLSAPIETRGNNEIGRLLQSLREMQQGLSATVATVRDSSQVILASTRDIADGNRDLAARTERQSAALSQTASSMAQMTATMARSNDSADEANRLTREAARRTEQGSEVVSQVVSRMHEIHQSSRQVTEIISLIDAIAFQTNILALNASVEAARAGEHGKGFAVVASEVRTLASRSAEAAAQIRRLIETTVAQVSAGTDQADAAGSTMAALLEAVHQVNALMEEIALASQEQRSGIGETNAAVSEMDRTTQQNAALVQQASQAAGQLEQEVERLDEAVARFRLAPGQKAPSTSSDTAALEAARRALPFVEATPA